MVIPIDKQVKDLLQKQHLAKLAAGKVKRASRLTRLSACVICGKAIAPGQNYKDAGIQNRAHVSCVPPNGSVLG